MAAPKIAVIYYSTYGTNAKVAQIAAKAAEAAGAEVRVRRIRETAPQAVVDGQPAWKAQLEANAHIPEVSLDDMSWADGYFFASPTRYGHMASQTRAFIDTLGPLWMQGGLVNKTITATSSSQNVNGGAEVALVGLYSTSMHWGAIPVPPGYSDPVKFADGGNPYGWTTTPGKVDETDEKSIAHQATRLVHITAKIAG